MTTLVEGQRIEQYRVVSFLGSSIAGEAYEVEDTRLQRKVTLKLLHPWARLPEMARRQFFREMQGISMLNHPSIATVLDYGEMGNALYIARRYVTPGSLLGAEGRTWFAPPLPITAAIQYTHQLAQGLQYIHDQGYLHGSLTFSNILVLRSSNLDNDPNFAPFLLSDIGTTHFIRRFGQPRTPFQPITAAPEQFGGHTTAASDQYALAVLLYFWLTGQLPFVGTPEEIEQLKLTETLVSPRQFNPALTLQQEGIIRRALSVFPDERYPSILSFTEALQTSLQTSESSHSAVDNPASTPPAQSLLATPVTEPLPPTEQSQQTTIDSETIVHSQQEASVHHTPVLHISHAGLPESITFTLEQDMVTLGRAGSSDIVLDLDDDISRHHALLRHEGEAYFIADQRSLLGIYINGRKLAEEEEYRLQPGDEITIGTYKLTFDLRDYALPDTSAFISMEA